MNCAILVLVAIIVGIIIGSYFAARGRGDGLLAKQAKRKSENKEKILEFLESNGKIANNDVERLCGVSNATAERYLNQLEKDGKLIQHGKIGRDVFYTLK